MNGFIRTAAVSPKVFLGDVEKNVQAIWERYSALSIQGVQVIVTPEMSLTGYTIMDLVQNEGLLTRALHGLVSLKNKVGQAVLIVGLPLQNAGRLYNCAAVLKDGKILGVAAKKHLPTGREFQESRWFTSGMNAPAQIVIDGETVPFGLDLIFEAEETTFAVEICEDLWTACPPSGFYAKMGAELIFNLSAGNELAAKHAYRKNLLAQQSARCVAGYVYAGAGYGESTTDLVFAGYTGVFENGAELKSGPRFSRTGGECAADVDVKRLKHHRMKMGSFFDGSFEAGRRITAGALAPCGAGLLRPIDPMPFVPKDQELKQRCEEITAIQVMALQTRMEKSHTQKLVLGVSGGLDSTLALLVAVMTVDEMQLPRENVIAVTMPGFGTGSRTYQNAKRLMQALCVTAMEIPIAAAVRQHFYDIGQDENQQDVTYENAQARERTQILMDLSNRLNGLTMGTGDLSEAALGFSTYNGDHMSMYNVNASVPKTLMRSLTGYLADTVFSDAAREVLHDVIATPVSPELLPGKDGEITQKTEEILGDYALHDFFLYHLMDSGSGYARLQMLAEKAFEGVYEKEAVEKALKLFVRRFYSQQFKRSCMPDGPKVGSVSLSPRGDWRMPSDLDYNTMME